MFTIIKTMASKKFRVLLQHLKRRRISTWIQLMGKKLAIDKIIDRKRENNVYWCVYSCC